ncbi:MAG: hypothetical protein HY056_05505 [Proteobacteria bacterium]|nr:hypothetical protein [Pseudomonadota bacterium]
MTAPTSIERGNTSLAREWLDLARYYLAGRRGFLALAAAAIVAGLAFNWDWMVATGLAPLLLAVLPCAVMCGLGLCFHRMSGSACAPEQSRAPPATNSTHENAAPSDRRDGAPGATTSTHLTSPSINERKNDHA